MGAVLIEKGDPDGQHIKRLEYGGSNVAHQQEGADSSNRDDRAMVSERGLHNLRGQHGCRGMVEET